MNVYWQTSGQNALNAGNYLVSIEGVCMCV